MLESSQPPGEEPLPLSYPVLCLGLTLQAACPAAPNCLQPEAQERELGNLYSFSIMESCLVAAVRFLNHSIPSLCLCPVSLSLTIWDEICFLPRLLLIDLKMIYTCCNNDNNNHHHDTTAYLPCAKFGYELFFLHV